MNRCKECLIPDTRPDTHFEDGICSACRSYKARQNIDWEARKKELLALLDRHDGQCIVPSSGGKDSHYQVLTLLELGADVTVVTATTCHLTEIGRKNIDNLARYAPTTEISPNKTVRAKLNRLGLQLVGDPSWPEHASIFTVPFRMAISLGIPLIFYGESPQNQYGGPPGTEEARQMTLRWVSEFGGFNGLRPSDFVGMEDIARDDMRLYEPPHAVRIEEHGIEAHFLGQYLPWDSRENARVAKEAGMICSLPSFANWWQCENLDNAQTGIHDYFMFLKYGLSRAAAQISVDIRSGLMSREEGLAALEFREARVFPEVYAEVSLDEILGRIGMKRSEFYAIAGRFTRQC